MPLKQPAFTYSACGTSTKNKEQIKNFKEAGDSRYIYQNKLDKSCFQHDMTYKDFKDLRRRTVANKVLCNKGFILLNIRNMMDINFDLLQCFIIFFDKKVPDGAIKKNHTK